MAWIESHTVLRIHRKVLPLSRALRINIAQTIGHLHLLWHAALEQQENGDLSQWSDELIAELAGYSGNDAPQFVRLLQEYGWLDGKVIHDWWDYSGRYLQGKYGRTPEKWQAIKAMFANNKQTADKLQGITGPTKPTKPDQPNQTNKPSVYVDWEASTLTKWNSFCDKHLSLSKIKELSGTRKKHLKARYEKESFRDFEAILTAIEEQPFLITGNQKSVEHKGWKVSFDWLIMNDTNYIKVLERKYKDDKNGFSEFYKKGV